MDAETLKRTRLGIGLNQAELARLVGVTPNTVSRWEKGTLAIGQPKMLALAMEAIQRRKNDIDLLELMQRRRDD